MHTHKGMSLIELMVVVVIVGILAGIAYPSYRNQVVRSKRTEAKVGLQQTAQSLENCFTRFHSYNSDDCDVRDVLKGAGIASEEGTYLVTVDEDTLDDLTFTLIATPQGAQATNDAGCGNFTLDQSNTRGVSGAKAVTECWK